jgi:hypothetical protein
MKKINYLFAITLLVAGCKKDTIFTYNAFDNVYFNYLSQGQPLDTAEVTFAYSPVSVTDTIFKVPLTVIGLASDHDRTYSVSTDTGTTAVSGKHFTLPDTFIFHAHQLVDSLPVRIIRTADLQTQAVILRIKLESTNDLHADMKTVTTLFGNEINLVSFKMNISDILGPGQYWTNVFVTYFGTFSVKKVRLINQITGMPLNYYSTGWLPDLNLSARASFYAISTARYLSDQKAAGNIIFEDDGITPMTMGAAYQ